MVDNDPQLRWRIIPEFHEKPAAGHLGSQATFKGKFYSFSEKTWSSETLLDNVMCAKGENPT